MVDKYNTAAAKPKPVPLPKAVPITVPEPQLEPVKVEIPDVLPAALAPPGGWVKVSDDNPGRVVVRGKVADKVGNGWNSPVKVARNLAGTAVGGFEMLPFVGNKLAAKVIPNLFGRKAYQEWVDPGKLERGSTLNDKAFDALAKAGIKSVVNLCAEDYKGDTREGKKNGVATKHLPVVDLSAPWPKGRQRMIDFLDFATKNDPCYVHCEAGKGRTSMAVSCYEMAAMGKGVEAALEDAVDHGCTQPAQLAFIKRFGESLLNRQIPGYPLKPMTGDTLEPNKKA